MEISQRQPVDVPTHQHNDIGVRKRTRGVVALLEMLDNVAHVVVAAFFILMATTVIVHMGFIFARQIPLMVPRDVNSTTLSNPAMAEQSAGRTGASSSTEKAASGATGSSASGGEGAAQASETRAPAAEKSEDHGVTDPFLRNSLELLSNILFVVILLELLRTIITYLETHDIQAIMQEFLVVAIISSVRKILLVGAEASLRQNASQSEFIQEASGVVIDIMGILLLIGGLVLLKRAFGTRTSKELAEA